MKQIRNVYCIGRNYVEHVKELNNQMPESPVVFSKPTHSLVQVTGQQIELPANKGDIHYEVELVVQLKTDYDQSKSVDEMVDTLYMGIDLTLREIQDDLKENRYPWLISKGFKNSAILSSSIPFPGDEQLKQIPFSLEVNGETVQKGKAEQMMFDLQAQLQYIGENLGLKAGDIVYTGTPSGVGALTDGDELSLKFNGEELGSCTIKLV